MTTVLSMCPIPDEMSWALKQRFYNNKKTYALIADEIDKSPLLKILIPRLYRDYIKSDSLESMLSAIGWNGFRDRLAAAYLYKFQNGDFPNKINIKDILEVKNFEDQFSNYVPVGDSRMFMCGFYLKLCDYKLCEYNEFGEKSLLRISEPLMNILKTGKQKSLRLDWIFLTLRILEELLSDDQFENIIKNSNRNFSSLLNQIDSQQKKYLIENLMIYGASINEQEMFIFDRV